MHRRPPPDAPPPVSLDAERRRAQIWLGTGLAMLLALLLLWQLRHVLLLVFAGTLLALALSALSGRLRRRWQWSPRLALGVVVLSILLLSVLGVGLAGGLIAAQLASLGETLPRALAALNTWLGDRIWGRWLLQLWQDTALGPQEMSRLASLAGGTLNAGLEAGATLLLVVALGIYFAADPQLYLRGFLRLLPARSRPLAEASLQHCACKLVHWLHGQGLTMLLVGLLTALGLGLIGMPLALTLAVIAGLLEFVPYVGTFAGSVLIVLVAFTQGESMALQAALVCSIVQLIEAYVLQPLAQRWAVRLPPALSLLAVLVFSLLFQLPGLLLAVPLMVLLMALVEQLWPTR